MQDTPKTVLYILLCHKSTTDRVTTALSKGGNEG